MCRSVRMSPRQSPEKQGLRSFKSRTKPTLSSYLLHDLHKEVGLVKMFRVVSTQARGAGRGGGVFMEMLCQIPGV